MGALTDVGVRIQFANTRFCETVDVRPEDDQHHHHTLHLPPHVGEGRIDLTSLGRGFALVWGHCIPRGEALRCRIEPTVSVTQLVFHRSGSATRVVLNGRTRSRRFQLHELMVLPPTALATAGAHRLSQPTWRSDRSSPSSTSTTKLPPWVADPAEQRLGHTHRCACVALCEQLH